MLLLVSFFLGFNTMFLGIIGEYVGRIYNQGKNRPLYLVDEQVNFDEAGEIATLPPRAGGSLNLPTLAERERGKIAVTRLICGSSSKRPNFEYDFRFGSFFDFVPLVRPAADPNDFE